MKRGPLLQIWIVLILGLGLNVAMPCFAQQHTIILAAKSDAEFDAEEDINTTVWLAAGGSWEWWGIFRSVLLLSGELMSTSLFRLLSDFSANPRTM